MLHVVLHEPEIPPNTGSIMRLCVNTGSSLHLVEPLGFELSDTKLRRAGLDYREFAQVRTYASLDAFAAQVEPARVVALSTQGKDVYSDFAYQPSDALLFGRESSGLDRAVLDSEVVTDIVRIPMARDSRSINLANAVSVVLYEALRQLGYPGLT